MSICIISRWPRERADFAEWLNDYNEDIYLITNRQEAAEYAAPIHVVPVEDIGQCGQVSLALWDMQRFTTIDRIVVFEEGDILHAARLRDRFEIPGQTYASALAFRNKVVMKEVAQRGGIPVSPFQALEAPLDAMVFAKHHGYPVVIKPMAGMSSTDTFILPDEQSLRTWLSNHSVDNMMVEQFVDGAVYHVDGIYDHGQFPFMVTSQYINTCLAYRTGKGTGHIVMNPSDFLAQRLMKFTTDLLAVMPTPAVTAFHTEIFVTPNGSLLLCEVASRAPAARVPELFQQAFGFNIHRALAQLQCGLPVEWPRWDASDTLVGCYYVPPGHGYIQEVPLSIPVEGVIRYVNKARSDVRYAGPQKSLDNIGIIFAEGADIAQVTARINEGIRYLDDNIVWIHER